MTRKLPLATRAFLFASIPMALTLVVSFFLVSRTAESRISDRLRESLKKTESALSRNQTEYHQRNLRTLAALTDNPSLKAGVGLLREAADPRLQEQVHETLARQLQGMAESLDYSLLLLKDAHAVPVAGVVGKARMLAKPVATDFESVSPSLLRTEGKLYEVVSVPINIGDENLATLVVGKEFSIADWSQFGAAALLQNGKVVFSTLPHDRVGEFEQRLAGDCQALSNGCELRVHGEAFLAMPVRRESFNDGIALLSFQSIDAATREFTQSLKRSFLLIAVIGVLLVFLVSAVGARSIARPLVALIEKLRREGSAGGFTAELGSDYQAAEVNELALEFTRAAGAIRDSERRLDEATEQFIESMAQAQDARDPYTAGHSERVSEISTSIASALGLSRQQVEIIRIGAKLHDLGKIGIPDALLRKPGKLTEEEYVLIQRHPQIGKEILEKVGRFSDFISVVELHHENPDGSGYPYGLRKKEIPLEVRIVHVADVWDAITTDRAYRGAMSIRRAWEIIKNGRGPLFDPDVVEAFETLLQQDFDLDPSRQIIVPQEMDRAFYPGLHA